MDACDKLGLTITAVNELVLQKGRLFITLLDKDTSL